MKDTLINQLDIPDKRLPVKNKYKPVEQDHKFKGPKARFKPNNTSEKKE